MSSNLSLITSQIAGGNSNTRRVTKFTKKVRNNDVETLEKGDEFIVVYNPEDEEDPRVLQNFMHPKSQDPEEAQSRAEYIVVDCNGTPKSFYPSSCRKVVNAVDKETGVSKGRIRATGNVVLFYKSFEEEHDFMVAMNGFKVNISNAQTIWAKDRYHDGPFETTVLEINSPNLDENGQPIDASKSSTKKIKA